MTERIISSRAAFPFAAPARIAIFRARPETERYNALMRALAIDPHPSIPLTQVDQRELAALIAEHGIEPERLVIVHPGAPLLSRRWPAERFAAVADALAARGWQIAITGSASEAALTGTMLGAMTAPALHLAGRTLPGGLAALVQRARLVVCNDTDVSHVAAAVKTRSVVVACGSDTRRWAPLDRERHRILADWPACRPCMYRDCPFGHPCALNIDVNEVATAALAQLGKDDQAHPAAPFTLHAQEWEHAA
jgi:ADP-heptose:LPS heptosyltransferase